MLTFFGVWQRFISKQKKTYIIFGPIHVILSEDETKVKTMVVWDSHWDTLKEFCCPRDNHVCVSN